MTVRILVGHVLDRLAELPDGLVADQLRRDAILIELNPEYAAMAEARIRADNSLFTEIAAE